MKKQDKEIKARIKVASSMKNYIAKYINSHFKDYDIKNGFTEIDGILKGRIYYVLPKQKMIKAIIKKSEMNLLSSKYKDLLPDVVYFV